VQGDQKHNIELFFIFLKKNLTVFGANMKELRGDQGGSVPILIWVTKVARREMGRVSIC
jgi:hypothetical protein